MFNCTLDYIERVLNHCNCVGRFKEEWKKGSWTDDSTPGWFKTCMVCSPRYILNTLIFIF